MVREGNKEQVILAIRSLNRSASAEFLAQFTESDLREYLGSLRGSSPTYRTFNAASKESRQAVAVG